MSLLIISHLFLCFTNKLIENQEKFVILESTLIYKKSLSSRKGLIMLEMYLFVNPTCTKCISAEKDVTKVATALQQKVRIKFIPVFELSTVSEGLTGNLDAYHLTLDYKAALFQGCKKGRSFLTELQEALLIKKQTYSEELVWQIAQNNQLDLQMFKTDRNSELCEKALQSDQQLSREMGVSNHDCLVLFDCATADKGIRIQDIEYSKLFELCSRLETNKKPQAPANSHLHIL
ncbi:hypothetical protein B808_1061 [Fructilactobacillus florum 8D]|uniref:Dithiol-disulfide isomerase n=2 Tax=Fructilactobacillus florum TaxID=640331 RepID=W9ECW6_9LACO|nr:hypothetical protein B807_972 [Fructilactobacillus florum 2F]ETO39953.1 hypothetical protein B808_1061 [Fructilactobacillus florum 8D]